MDKPADEAVPDINAALAGFVAGGVALYALRDSGDHPINILAVVGFVTLALCLVVASWVRRRHGTFIKPFLARTAGLSFSPKAKEFIAGLPTRLLPRASVRKGEDLLSGLIGDRNVEMAEVKFETGGKNSTTLFQGVVLSFPNVAPLPPFFIVSEAQTEKRFLVGARIAVDGLVRVGSRLGGNVAYGVWASSPDVAERPALDAMLKILIDLDPVLGWQADLLSATSNDEVIHIALSHKRDLFRMGGLFATSDRLMQDVRQAYVDLTLPMATRLLEVERATLA